MYIQTNNTTDENATIAFEERLRKSKTGANRKKSKENRRGIKITMAFEKIKILDFWYASTRNTQLAKQQHNKKLYVYLLPSPWQTDDLTKRGLCGELANACSATKVSTHKAVRGGSWWLYNEVNKCDCSQSGARGVLWRVRPCVIFYLRTCVMNMYVVVISRVQWYSDFYQFVCSSSGWRAQGELLAVKCGPKDIKLFIEMKQFLDFQEIGWEDYCERQN